MAYVIYNHDSTPDKLSRITNDSDEKTAWLEKNMLVHEITESDFNDLKNNIKFPDGWDGTNIIYTDKLALENEEQLTNYLNGLKSQIEDILQYDYNVSMDAWQTYLTYLNNFDVSTVSFPIASWEKYCDDNSITFQSLLIRP